MKLKSLISALIVFTLVMTCAMSAVSAAECSYTTTTTYSTTGDVTVTTNVAAGLSDGSMVSYVIYDDSNGGVPSESTIKYIDQKTFSSGTLSFGVTDTVAKLYGKKILMGSNLDTLSAAADASVNGYVTVNPSDLFVTFDTASDITFDENTHKLTVFVKQSNNSAVTGVNIYAYEGETLVHEFLGLENLNTDNLNYAIELVDDTDNKGILSSSYTYKVVPYVVNSDEMVSVGDYWVVAAE